MQNLQRIQSLSWVLFWISTALLFCAPAIILGGVALIAAPQNWLAARFVELPDGTVFSTGKRFVILATDLLASLPMVWVIWQMRGLFQRYMNGEVLTQPCAGHILRAGLGLISLAALLTLLPSLQILLLTLDNLNGTRVFSISIRGADIALALAGGLIVVVGWVMREATAEIEGFV
jgi:hypothetical protein